MPAEDNTFQQRPLASSIALDQVHLPEEVRAMLLDGVSFPLLARSAEHPSEESAATASITVKLNSDGNYVLGDVKPVLGRKGSVLNERANALLHAAEGAVFAPDGSLAISPSMRIQLDMLAMQADLYVGEQDFGVLRQAERETLLPASSSSGLSSVMKYTFNGYHSKSGEQTSNNGYLSFDNLSSLGEHHLNISGSANIGDNRGSKSANLDRVMYERDLEGRRLAVGMMDGWSMQSLANVSTLDQDRVYGVSYGNLSHTLKVDASQSLSPIDIYFPSSGEARVKRDGRLLSIQRFNMGNHRLDTSVLPSGVYDVEVETVIGGQVTGTRTYRVNKPSGGTRDGLSWQVWGGASETSPGYSGWNQVEDDRKYRPLAGVSLGGRVGTADWTMSLYRNDKTTVGESRVTWQVWDNLRLDYQNLQGSDRTRRNLTSLNYSLPDGVGSVWMNSERGRSGDKLNYSTRDYDSVGGSIYLNRWISKAGSLNVSYDKDRNTGRKYMQASYSQQVYSGRWGSAQLNVGTNRNVYDGVSERKYYGNLNITLPLDANFGIGFSHQDSSNTIDLNVSKSIDDSFITGVGANVSINHDLTESGSNTTNYGGYVNFDGRYGQGTLSVDTGKDSHSANLSVQGSVAVGGGSVAAGSGYDDSGIIFNVNDAKDRELEAVINDQSYPLLNGRNLVSLPPYSTYRVYVRGAENGEGSYEVADSEREYTLYPGNVMEVKPAVKQLVTVFGYLAMEDGTPLKNVTVKNHIGIAQTDENGNFAIDVDRSFPEVMVESQHGGEFKVSMNLDNTGSTAWLGKVIYGQHHGRVYQALAEKDES